MIYIVFDPDLHVPSKEEIEEGLKECTFNELVDMILELNDFYMDLAAIFKEERDVKGN